MVDGEGGDCNFYDVFGISRHASDQEVKTRYRKLALTAHPDRGGDPERFNLISKAYEVLSNPQRRKQYDTSGRTDPVSLVDEFRSNFFGLDGGMTVMEERRERERREREAEAERQRAEDFQGLRVINFEDPSGATHSRPTVPAWQEQRMRVESAAKSADTPGQPPVARPTPSTAQPAERAWPYSAAPVQLAPGVHVEIFGVKARPEMNRMKGVLIGQQEDRWHVRFEGQGGDKLVKARNLRPTAGQAAPAPNSQKTSGSAAPGTFTNGFSSSSTASASIQGRGVSQAGERPRYCVVGAWNCCQPRDMYWDPSQNCFLAVVDVASPAKGTFQIWRDGKSEKCLHPDRPDAHFSDCVLRGPDTAGFGRQWLIGGRGERVENSEAKGSKFQIRLFLNEKGEVKTVDWVKVGAGVNKGEHKMAGNRKETAQELGVPRRQYEVIHDLVYVRRAPSLESPAIGQRIKGQFVVSIEESFDGWIKLEGEYGWLCKDMRGMFGLGVLLTPVGVQPSLPAAPELADSPGPQRFKVMFSPQVVIRTLPSKSAEVRSFKKCGEIVDFDSQTYNGWLRLSDGTGWMLSSEPTHGELLRCCYLENRSAKLASETARADELEADLQNAVAAGDAAWIAQAMEQVRSVGHGDSEAMRIAEKALITTRMREEHRNVLKRRIDLASGKATELRRCIDEATANGWQKEIAQASGLLDAAIVEDSKIAQTHGGLLDLLASAAASGDKASIKEARDAAKKGGVSTKEIARVFALHSQKNDLDAPAPVTSAAEAMPKQFVNETTPAEVQAATPTQSVASMGEAGVQAAAPAQSASNIGKSPSLASTPQTSDNIQPDAPTVNAEEAGEAAVSASLDGDWWNPSEHVARIIGDTIHWSDGPAKELHFKDDGSISTEMFNMIFTGVRNKQGFLEWSDGDVWSRGPDPAEVASDIAVKTAAEEACAKAAAFAASCQK